MFLLYALVLFRICISFQLAYLFLFWNSFLALIPYACSQFMLQSSNKIYTSILLILGILFLPNALYLISDFEHLVERPPIPFFFDILLMFFAAFFGLLLNVFALQNMHDYLKKYFKNNTANFIIGAIILLSGFGVYLGRYLRWNSWDIFVQPQVLLSDCVHRFVQPWQYTFTWSVSLGYAFILALAYLFFQIKNEL